MTTGPATRSWPSAPTAGSAGRSTRGRGAAEPKGASPDGAGAEREACCELYHHAVELVGKRWTGAILLVLMDGSVRFSEAKQLVPELSDRLLSERMKELEAEGIVRREVREGSPVRVEYALTAKGRALEPTVRALKSWANAWLR